MGRRAKIVLICLVVLLLALLPLGLLVGSVSIPASDVFTVIFGGEDGVVESNPVWELIVLETRVPGVFTAVLAGAALAVAGLLMQTCFNNPLADPSIMGISTGASLGVAVMLMAVGGAVGVWGRLATVGGAFIGAMAVMFILLLFASKVRSSDTLLIVGILIGYLASSGISLLNYFSTSERVHSFVIWGLGNFSAVTSDMMPLFATLTIVFVLISQVFVKPLNAMLLGARYASNVGVDVAKTRIALLALSGALTAIVTAWCGPIGFIGLVVPHISRMLLKSSNHAILLPVTALTGAALALICRILSVVPSISNGVIPINAITPLIGVPVIIYVMLNRRKLVYFN